MRDCIVSIVKRNNVLKDTAYEYPEEYWEEREPYEPSGSEPELQEEAMIPNQDDSWASEEELERYSMEKAPRIFKSLLFDSPPPGASCIKKQEYTLFISASLKEYQKNIMKSPKKEIVDKPRPLSF